jgi:O-antigen/teichoic acid export membrane protein
VTLRPLAASGATNCYMSGERPYDPRLPGATRSMSERRHFKKLSAGSMYRRIARNYSLLASGTAASSVLLMLAAAVSARALTVRDFGLLVLLQSATLFLRGLGQFATFQPIVTLGAEAQAAADKARLGRIVSMGITVDFAASLLTFVVAAILIETAGRPIGLGDASRSSAWILAASLLFSSYVSSHGVVRLFDRFGTLSAIQTFSALGLLVAFAILFRSGANLQSFACAWAIYLAINGQLQLWFSLYLVQRHAIPLSLSRRSFASADGRMLLQYCWSTWAISSADTIRTAGDSLLVGAIVSVESAGLYNAARKLAGVLRKFNLVHNSAIFPEFARLKACGDGKKAKRLKRRMIWAAAGGGALAVVAAGIFGKFAIELLYGPRFAGAYVTFVILVAAAAAQLTSFTSSMCVQIYISPRLLMLLHLLATLAFIVSAVALTFTFSIAGMAVAQLVFALTVILLCEIALRGQFDVKPGSKGSDPRISSPE